MPAVAKPTFEPLHHIVKETLPVLSHATLSHALCMLAMIPEDPPLEGKAALLRFRRRQVQGDVRQDSAIDN